MRPTFLLSLVVLVLLSTSCNSDDDFGLPGDGFEICDQPELFLPQLDSWELEVVNTSVDGVIYMFSETDGLIISGDQLYQTTDGLVSLVEVEGDLPNDVDALGIISANHWLSALHSVDSGGYFVSTIMKTEDAGLSWDTVLVQSRDLLYVTGFHFTNELKGFADLSLPSTDGGNRSRAVAMTTDGGYTWEKVVGPRGLRGGVQFLNDTLGYFLSPDKVYKTTDGGTTCSSQGYAPYLTGISAIDENILYGKSLSETYKSVDGGQSWEQLFDFRAVLVRAGGNDNLMLGNHEQIECKEEDMTVVAQPQWAFFKDTDNITEMVAPVSNGLPLNYLKRFPTLTIMRIGTTIITVKNL